VVLPLAGFGLYLRLGSPGLPGEPAGMGASIVTPDSQGSQGWTATDGAAPTAPDIAAAAQMSDSDRQAMIAVMVAKLADRLKVQPEDLEGWTRLARAYDVLGRSDESRKAWSQVARLAPTRLDAQLGYASSMIAGAADSSLGLSPDFVATVTRIRALAPENPLGLYFGGMVARASGDNAAAREMWIRVLALIPPGVASRTSLQREIDSLPP
jgi:cytochrome c-type biogenesis protein CcmH